MDTLKIRYFPDKILREKAQAITRIDQNVRELAEAMLGLMKKSSGVGLAANQVGKTGRIVVIGNLPDILDEPLIMINPEIKDSESWNTLDEGCLSFPGISASVRRKSKVYAVFGTRRKKK